MGLGSTCVILDLISHAAGLESLQILAALTSSLETVHLETSPLYHSLSSQHDADKNIALFSCH